MAVVGVETHVEVDNIRVNSFMQSPLKYNNTGTCTGASVVK